MISLASKIARAQVPEAEALFAEGDRLMESGALAKACEAFAASNHLEARAGTLIRLGECREQNQQLASAWSAYKDAASRAKDPAKLEIATKKVAELEPVLSHLTISAAVRSPAMSIVRDGQPFDSTLLDHELPIDGGDHVIVVTAPGFRRWETRVRVDARAAKAVVVIPQLVADAKPAVVAPERPHGLSMRRKLAIGLASGSGAALGLGIGFGISARSNQQRADALCGSPSTPCVRAVDAASFNRTAHSRAIIADLGFAAATALAAGAAFCWLTGAHAELVPTLSSNSGGLAIIGAF